MNDAESLAIAMAEKAGAVWDEVFSFWVTPNFRYSIWVSRGRVAISCHSSDGSEELAVTFDPETRDVVAYDFSYDGDGHTLRETLGWVSSLTDGFFPSSMGGLGNDGGSH